MVKKKEQQAPMLRNYFNTLDYNINKFGEKTILLWQCGGFYEVYALKNEDKKDFERGKLQIETVNEVCNFSIVAKGKQMFDNLRLFMAGIPTTADMERIIEKLKNEGFTIVLFGEIGDDPISKGKIREQLGIFSPGTHFNLDSKKISNNIMCIWLEERKVNFLNKVPFVIMGMSCIDIFTGKSSLYQYSKKGNKLHNPTTFDDLSRFFSIYNPEELIFIHNYENEDKIEDIIQFASLYSTKTYKINLNKKETELQNEANQFEKQTYQEKILNKFYKIKDYGGFMEITNLANYYIGCKSFCFLLNFIYCHNPSLVYNIHKPVFENSSNKLILANHSLHQLNIVETHQDKGKYSSLQKFLNKCITPMGKRRFNDLLVHPTTDEIYLNKEYDIVDYLLNDYDEFFEIRKQLSKIRDIERLYRKIILNKVLPCEIAQFYYNMETIINIDKNLSKHEKLRDYINGNIKIDINKNCKEVMNYIKKYMNLEASLAVNNVKGEINFMNRGNFKHLDKADTEHTEINKILQSIRKYFSDLIKTNKKQQKNKNILVKIHTTEKRRYLEVTNTRLNILKQELKRYNNKINLQIKINENELLEYELDLKTLKFTSGTGGNKKIDGDSMQKIYFKILQTQDNLKESLLGSYKEFIRGGDEEKSLQSFDLEMDYFVRYVSLLDLILTKMYLAKKYNYCRPIINSEANKSYVDVKQIRHPLIEQIQQNELYVANDIRIGDETNGILLYGINAVGKSSFIRSLGVSVIMAQAGLFVPCSNMEYKPYSSLYTRILGIDNIFKGLSTFAVEMCELSTIITESDENSLILGDELCKGTEHPSALSLFSSGLISLSEKRATYIFATHFHELTTYEKIVNIQKLKFKHISVKCDGGVLIYDRILRNGPGSNMYGLEVCKSLDMPQDFLDRAYEIRKELYPEYKGIGEKSVSSYNKQLVKDMCELCEKNMGEEVHHLNRQELADNDGFINTFHKNHKGNLINICKKCHKKVTKNKKVHKKTKTSEGMKLIEI